ncbi:hypothetical protein [Legionella cherrii]|nr:hypothetical protein [Legionella cherrii]
MKKLWQGYFAQGVIGSYIGPTLIGAAKRNQLQNAVLMEYCNS